MSTNPIDPKLLSAWIKTNMLSAADITAASLGGPDGANVGDDGADFAGMLELLTSAQGNGTAPDALEPAAYGLEPLARGAPLRLAALSSAAETTREGAKTPADLEAIIERAGARYGVDPALVRAVIRTESGFDPTAESRAGAKGLMQLMDATARSLGVDDPFDPEQNVNGGTRFLSSLLTKYNGNVGVALAAYNAGPGRVDRLGIKTDADLAAKLERLPKETQSYVRKVLGTA